MAKRKRAPAPALQPRFTFPEWLLPAGALAALVVAVYANSLFNGFVSDDKIQLLRNPLLAGISQIPRIFRSSVWSILQTPASPGNYYRPMQFLVYMGLYQCAGFSAPVFHAFMVLLHAANTLLLYFLVRRLASARLALAAGALFAIHPIHTEVVDWIAALPDLMVTTVALLAIFWLARSVDPPRGLRIAGHCVLYLLALLTKETGVMLLPLYAGFGFFYRERGWHEFRRNAPLYAGLAATFCVYLAMRWAALGNLAPGQQAFFHLTPLAFALSVVVIGGQYLAALLFPINLSYFHIFHPTVAFTPALAISFVALAAPAIAVFRFRTPLLAYGAFWIAATLAPAFNLTGVGQNVFAERYLYLPSAGFCWIAAWAWVRLANYKPAWAMAAGALLLLGAGAEVIARNRDWRDDFTLFQVSLRQAPTSGWLHNWMAGACVERRDVACAMEEEQLAVRYEPRAPSFHENLGNILLLTNPRAAVSEFEKLLALAPGRAESHSDLAIALEAAGEPDRAAAEYETVLRLQPGNQEAREGYRRVTAHLQ